jgi:PAS domain S-box-containing protein
MHLDKINTKQFINNFLSFSPDDTTDIEIKRKAILLYVISIIGILNLVPLGISAIIRDKLTLGAFDLIVAGVLIVLLLWLIKIGYHLFMSFFGVALAGALFVYLFATGGINDTGHLWSYTFPLFASFLLGSKKGAIATLILLGLAILVFSIENQSFITATFSRDLKIRFISSFIVVFAFSVAFENVREKTQQQLGEKNNELKETIFELTKAEEALKDSATLLKATIESTADGILVVDNVGQVLSRNTRFGDMWQIPEDILQRNDDEKSLNFVLDQLKNPQMFISKVQELYKTDRKDFDILAFKDGRVFERYSEPLIIDDNRVGRVWSFRDITERKRAEEERARLQNKLQQAQKMKAVGTLAGGVAHDLNNILSGIVSYPELLLLDLPEDSPMRDSIKTIQESGKKAAAIVQDLLTLARRGVPTNEIVNLNDVISEYLISPEFNKLKSFHPLVEIETCFGSSLLNIVGSPVHLSKTVMNLVSNAAEAMSEGGTIRLSTENEYIDQLISGYDEVVEGEYVVLTITDPGVGIAAEEINRIFEPFYTKKVMGRSGTGLGMAVVWGTVEDHKGYIHVESELEKGTTFKLYFPITRKEIPRKQNPKELADYTGNGESILVVDDVKEQREIASNILSQLGYSVRLASSGEEAVNYIRNETADLIVLDMIMSPGIDGLETYEQILSMHPNQKAIIASGFSETNRVKKTQKLGAGTYVRKPYTIEKIGMAVKAELKKKEIAA